MSHTGREQLFDNLAELRHCYPGWRLGQLIANVADWADQNVWDVEDEQLLAAVEQHLHTLASTNFKAST